LDHGPALNNLKSIHAWLRESNVGVGIVSSLVQDVFTSVLDDVYGLGDSLELTLVRDCEGTAATLAPVHVIAVGKAIGAASLAVSAEFAAFPKVAAFSRKVYEGPGNTIGNDFEGKLGLVDDVVVDTTSPRSAFTEV